MAILNKIFRVLALMVVVGIDKNNIAVRGDIRGLIVHCASFVRKGSPKVDPSPACCNVIKMTDVGCACPHLTNEPVGMLDMGKVVHVAAFCGKPFAHGSKCGSYTVP